MPVGQQSAALVLSRFISKITIPKTICGYPSNAWLARQLPFFLYKFPTIGIYSFEVLRFHRYNRFFKILKFWRVATQPVERSSPRLVGKATSSSSSDFTSASELEVILRLGRVQSLPVRIDQVEPCCPPDLQFVCFFI